MGEFLANRASSEIVLGAMEDLVAGNLEWHSGVSVTQKPAPGRQNIWLPSALVENADIPSQRLLILNVVAAVVSPPSRPLSTAGCGGLEMPAGVVPVGVGAGERDAMGLGAERTAEFILKPCSSTLILAS